MLNAEGPEAFEDGFRKLQEVFEDDEAKVGYITELYNDADKAHFKRELIFTNGVLVDLCETLFNAVKVWVYGSARNRFVNGACQDSQRRLRDDCEGFSPPCETDPPDCLEPECGSGSHVPEIRRQVD